MNVGHFFDSKKRLTETVVMLEDLGYRAERDFFVEDVLRVHLYFECSTTKILTRTRYEEGEYKSDKKDFEIGSELHKDTQVIGWIITDENGKRVDISAIEAMTAEMRRAAAKDRCAVCGAKIVLSYHTGDDQRRELDGLKCFDHRGMCANPAPEKTMVRPSLPLEEEKKSQPPPQKGGLEIWSQ